jgi:hypothetical protein
MSYQIKKNSVGGAMTVVAASARKTLEYLERLDGDGVTRSLVQDMSGNPVDHAALIEAAAIERSRR